jgi:hypothetical protein
MLPKSDKPDPILNPNFLHWHTRQTAEAEPQKQPFAAFHLERLYRLQPAHAVRERLLAALKQTPDSPAGRNVRDRLLAFDAARLAGAAADAPCRLSRPDRPLPNGVVGRDERR